MSSNRLLRIFFISLLLLSTFGALAIGEKEEDDAPAAFNANPGSAPIINNEGGPAVITGELNYTNALFTSGVDEPLVILEDQAGFIDRNEYFIFPLDSQVLGQITSDFFTSPFSYSLALPLEPAGSLRDVDNDGEEDSGLMVFAIAYWTNLFGDLRLQKCDMYGGGWSTSYASTRASSDPATRLEIIGGKFIIYAPEAGQGFPNGFGEDGLLFTADDPIVTVPQGYSVVDMDSEPFAFDRSARPVIDLNEPAEAALNDFSAFSYSEAFRAMVDLFRREYAYTELYELDWDALEATYASRFTEAEDAEDAEAYALAMRDFIWEIPDGHVGMPLSHLSELFREETDGGLGISLSELEDGRIVVSYLIDGSPAANAGMQLGAEILAWDGGSVQEAMDREFVWAHQALSTEHTLRLQQLRYITRFALGADVEITFRNPEGDEDQSVTLTTIGERASFNHSSFFAGIEGWELPLEYEILPSGYGYVTIYSFSDNERLTIELWERMIETFNDEGVPGIIIDMRQNGGGSGYLADQLGAYFFNEEHILGYSSSYNEAAGEFYLDPRSEDRFCLPDDVEHPRYAGEIAVIIAPGCFSACEFFSYNLAIDDRAAIVGHYPTGGLGGAVDDFLMPEDMSIRFTVTRALDADYNIHIEAQGVAPTLRVPVTMESLTSEGDPLLEAAEEHLTGVILGELIDGGELSLGIGSTEIQANGTVGPDQRIRYRVTLPANRTVSVYLSGSDETVDTVLGIYDREGKQLLAENDDADEDSRSSALTDLAIGANAGVFVFEVRIKDISEVQSFTIEVVGVDPEDDADSEEEASASAEDADEADEEDAAAGEDSEDE
ncbi:MAG: S41 family peptidase [Chloroflexi bacterium]|nr:S41 family peptidase [Chloroflexota bacterium]